MRSFALCVAGILSLGACARQGRDATASSFRVALLTPGPISDQAWNAGAYAGLLRIRDSLGAQISHIQVKTPSDFEENFRQYGTSGYSLVIGHGFEFQDAAARVAPDHPKTVYVTTGGETVRANLAALSFAFDEPATATRMTATSWAPMAGAFGPRPPFGSRPLSLNLRVVASILAAPTP